MNRSKPDEYWLGWSGFDKADFGFDEMKEGVTGKWVAVFFF